MREIGMGEGGSEKVREIKVKKEDVGRETKQDFTSPFQIILNLFTQDNARFLQHTFIFYFKDLDLITQHNLFESHPQEPY